MKTRMTKRTGTGLLAAVAFALTFALPATAAERPHAGFLKAGVAVSAPKGATGICGRYSWACDTSGSRVGGQQAMALADEINREVNRRVRPVSDQAQYGRVEYWTLPGNRGGDCEDYALEKKRLLMERGLSGEQLLLTTVLDRRRQPHAVLVLRTASGDFVLDNLTNQIKPWRATGYTFLRMQDPAQPRQWRALFAGGVFNAPTATN